MANLFRKGIIGCLFFTLFSGGLFSQMHEEILCDWDQNVFDWEYSPGLEVVDNPLNSFDNLSLKCAKLLTTQSYYDLIYHDFEDYLNFEAYPYYKLSVLPPESGGKIALKFENADNTHSAMIVKDVTPGQWNELLFDLSDSTFKDYKRIVIFYDFEGNTGGESWYLDNVIQIGTGVPESITPVQKNYQMIIHANDTFNYFVGTYEPPANWNDTIYSGNDWNYDKGGFGYADGDDSTTIPSIISCYFRKKFLISDLSSISNLMLYADYDDGFVAYINGREIARANLPEGFIAYDQTTLTDHEAGLYRNVPPEEFTIDNELKSQLNLSDTNIFAVQIHNVSATSSDISSNFFLVNETSDTNIGDTVLPQWISNTQIFESNLPILRISTSNQDIPNEPRILARLEEIDYTGMNQSSMSPTGYDGRVTIEIRGSSSVGFGKKSYSFETQDSIGENNNVSLLGLPPENDWVLYGPFSDKSMLRNALTYYFGGLMGLYSPRFKYCEVVLNGDYNGIYLLTEKIKRDRNRVDIATLTPADTSGDELTGGYIIKVDKTDEAWNGWESYPEFRYPDAKTTIFQYSDPDFDELTIHQKAYIQDYTRKFENALASNQFTDENVGYKYFIDDTSFANYLLISEITKEVDNYRYSVYLHKNKDSEGGKLKMGPLWDFNLGFANCDYWDPAVQISGWTYDIVEPYAWSRIFWFKRLMESSHFQNLTRCQWEDYRNNFLSTEKVFSYMDSLVNYISEAQSRNDERWNLIGNYVWPNYYLAQSYEDEITWLKGWIEDRLTWMDNNLPGECIIDEIDRNIESITGLSVYPNPMLNKATINLKISNPGMMVIELSDITGRIVSRIYEGEITTSNFNYTWNIPGEIQNSPGVYIMSIKLNNDKIVRKKVIVKGL